MTESQRPNDNYQLPGQAAPRNSLFVILLVLTFISLCARTHCWAQDTLAAPQLELRGPAGQTVIYTVRYFSNHVAGETIHSRVDLPADGSPLELQSLDFGYDGLQVQIAVATSQPFSVRLLDGDQVLREKSTQAAGMIDLRYGGVPEGDSLTMPRALLTPAESQFVERFIQGIRLGSAEPLVSSLPLANIDWQTLSTYFDTLTRELGVPQTEMKEQLDGWISWEGSLGARVLSGKVEFTNGSCHFKLMQIEGKLVDVVPRAPALAEDWMDQPPKSLDAYIAQAHRLTQALLAGNVSGGQLLFSQRYHEDVTVEVVEELSRTLRAMVDDHDPTLEFKRFDFSLAAPQSSDRRLRIHSVIKSDSGQRCLGHVDFVFPSGEDVIGRGHLSSIYIHEAWNSAAPELAQHLAEMLSSVGSEEPRSVATKWMKRMHPELQPHIDQDKLAQFIESLGQAIGTKTGEIDFDLWESSESQQSTGSTAYGPVEFALAPQTTVQSHWSDDKWIGLTFVSAQVAMSTLDLIPQYQVVQDRGVRIWTHLFGGQFAAAHELLDNRFRERFTLVQLTELCEESEFPELAQLRAVTLDRIRVLERDNRPQATMFSAYFIAEFVDDSYFPVSCELTFDSQTSTFSIMNFSTDVVHTFPIAAEEMQLQFWNAFANADPAAIGRMVSEATRQNIQPVILAAFLSELQELLGVNEGTLLRPATRMLREYDLGNQLLRLNSQVVGPKGIVDVEASFERKTLRNFHFKHPALSDFVHRIADQTFLDSSSNQFIDSWLSAENLRPENRDRLARFLTAELRGDAGMSRLEELHRRILLEAGELVSVEIVSRTPLRGANLFDIELLVQLERETRTIRLTYEVNAIEGVIAAVEVTGGSE